MFRCFFGPKEPITELYSLVLIDLYLEYKPLCFYMLEY